MAKDRNKRKACILSTGCPESRLDSARMINLFRANGWIIVDDFREADMILYRTCGLTKITEKESLNTIRKISSRKKKEARLIPWGCLPKINKEALHSVYDGETFGEKDVELIDEIINSKISIKDVNAFSIVPNYNLQQGLVSKLLRQYSDQFSSIRQKPKTYYIKVSTGCLGYCTYCAIRLSRGLLQSKEVDRILHEFRSGLRRGYKYFSLIGTEVGAYGQEKGLTLIDLLKEMIKEEGNYQIGLRNINPLYLNEMFKELEPLMKSQRIWFILSPVESGSNRILNLMGRRYKIEDFKKSIIEINTKYPNIMLRTQMMVGFPTETEEDFKKSLRVIEELSFDWIEVYRYSRREGTRAARMQGQIHEKTKQMRFLRLLSKAVLYNVKRKIEKSVT
jgi:MiaB/RimO family radical SAM methylthiotransferase